MAISELRRYIRMRYYLIDSLKKRWVLNILKKNGLNLKYIHEFQSDKELIFQAVKYEGKAIAFSTLRDETHIVERAVETTPKALQYASERLRDDFYIVENAVRRCGAMLEYASDRLKDDKRIVSLAIQQNGRAIQFASHNQKRDIENIKLAIVQSSRAFRHLYDSDRMNKEIILIALKHSGKNIKYIPQELRNDKEIIRMAISNYPLAILYYDFIKSPEMEDNTEEWRYFLREACIKAISLNVHQCIRLVDHYHNDDEIARLALKLYPGFLTLIGEWSKRREFRSITVNIDFEILRNLLDNNKYIDFRNTDKIHLI